MVGAESPCAILCRGSGAQTFSPGVGETLAISVALCGGCDRTAGIELNLFARFPWGVSLLRV